LAGTASVQFSEAAACAAVWFRLMAAPVPSTGVVAMSPSFVVAIGPLANELAGGTVAPVPVVAVEVALALALALADGLAVALADPDAVGLADAVGVPPW
jgi:hypothetical protein